MEGKTMAKKNLKWEAEQAGRLFIFPYEDFVNEHKLDEWDAAYFEAYWEHGREEAVKLLEKNEARQEFENMSVDEKLMHLYDLIKGT
jgi:hypothetical protein